jgi:hypothetical protein
MGRAERSGGEVHEVTGISDAEPADIDDVVYGR